MRECPTFSVVIPCYNYGHYLGGALESVFAQGRSDVQVILVDDSSSDNTHQVAKSYGDRILYIRNSCNLGAGGAWRVGLDQVQGDYVIKLDADDMLLPDHFNRVEAAFLSDCEIGLVVASVLVNKEREGVVEREMVTDADVTLGRDELRCKLLNSFFFRMPSCTLKRSILQGHEPPDPKLYQVHDWEYFLRASNGHKCRLLKEPGAIYRVHGKSITATAQFNNRLFNDIHRWLSIAAEPGERHLGEQELRILRGSCAELLLIGFGPKYDPRSYARYLYKYYRALRIAWRGGFDQVIRMHKTLLTKIVDKFSRRYNQETTRSTSR